MDPYKCLGGWAPRTMRDARTSKENFQMSIPYIWSPQMFDEETWSFDSFTGHYYNICQRGFYTNTSNWARLLIKSLYWSVFKGATQYSLNCGALVQHSLLNNHTTSQIPIEKQIIVVECYSNEIIIFRSMIGFGYKL
jgi:hypothetical protein